MADNIENIFTAFIIYVYCKINKLKLIIWTETINKYPYFPNDKLKYKLSKIFYKAIHQIRMIYYGDANGIICLSEKSKKFVLSSNINKNKIFEGGQVLIASSPICCESKIVFKNDNTNKKIILYLGYLRQEKGIEYLVKAFNNLHRDDVLLFIAGNGNEYSKLKSMANDSTFFFGHVTDIEKEILYGIADIFVLPTLYDPWGLVINEAMHHSLPIITTDAAGCSDYLINNNGFIVSPGNEMELFNALLKLIDDDELRYNMGNESKKIISRFDLDYAIKPFIRAIEQ
jgi:glycosyltransferase involved in cell wall biosynthesis